MSDGKCICAQGFGMNLSCPQHGASSQDSGPCGDCGLVGMHVTGCAMSSVPRPAPDGSPSDDWQAFGEVVWHGNQSFAVAASKADAEKIVAALRAPAGERPIYRDLDAAGLADALRAAIPDMQRVLSVLDHAGRVTQADLRFEVGRPTPEGASHG